MDDDKYDELLGKGLRTTTLEIPISDHVWRAFKRACEYAENNGRPYPEKQMYRGFLEHALESYMGDLVPQNLADFFLAEALQQVWEEKDKEQEEKQITYSGGKNAPTPGEGMG